MFWPRLIREDLLLPLLLLDFELNSGGTFPQFRNSGILAKKASNETLPFTPMRQGRHLTTSPSFFLLLVVCRRAAVHLFICCTVEGEKFFNLLLLARVHVFVFVFSQPIQFVTIQITGKPIASRFQKPTPCVERPEEAISPSHTPTCLGSVA